MKILSLDLSTKTGWSALVDGQLIDCGLIKPSKEAILNKDTFDSKVILKVVDFIEKMSLNIRELLILFNPDKVVIEQTNAGVCSSRLTQKLLEWIHYRVLITVVSTLKFYPDYISTSRWRSNLGVVLNKEQRVHNKQVKNGDIKGKITPKHLAVQKVNELYGLDFKIKDNDKADAILMGLAFWRIQNGIT